MFLVLDQSLKQVGHVVTHALVHKSYNLPWDLDARQISTKHRQRYWWIIQLTEFLIIMELHIIIFVNPIEIPKPCYWMI